MLKILASHMMNHHLVAAASFCSICLRLYFLFGPHIPISNLVAWKCFCFALLVVGLGGIFSKIDFPRKACQKSSQKYLNPKKTWKLSIVKCFHLFPHANSMQQKHPRCIWALPRPLVKASGAEKHKQIHKAWKNQTSPETTVTYCISGPAGARNQCFFNLPASNPKISREV